MPSYLDRDKLYTEVIDPAFGLGEDTRKVAAAANSLLRELEFVLTKFAYYVDCQLATYEHEAHLARPRKGELRRHRGLCEKILAHADEFGIKPKELARLKDRFARSYRKDCTVAPSPTA